MNRCCFFRPKVCHAVVKISQFLARGGTTWPPASMREDLRN